MVQLKVRPVYYKGTIQASVSKTKAIYFPGFFMIDGLYGYSVESEQALIN